MIEGIRGVPTSIAAFLGEAERGPLKPQLINSAAEYQRWFGGPFAADRYLPAAVEGFFANGGRRLYVARIVGRRDGEESRAPDAIDFEGDSSAGSGALQGLRALDAPEYSDVSLVYAPHPPAHAAE